MPNRRLRRALAGASLALLAMPACVPRATPPTPLPAPAPGPVPVPRPAPPTSIPVVTTPAADWQTGPLSPGTWDYALSSGTPGAIFRSDRAAFAITCRNGEITLSLSGSEGALVIITSYGERRLATGRVPATDPLLDQMAFSRGRIMVGGNGGPALVVPAWPEIGRVIEDCRGQ